jgi:hypothetical protein
MRIICLYCQTNTFVIYFTHLFDSWKQDSVFLTFFVGFSYSVENINLKKQYYWKICIRFYNFLYFSSHRCAIFGTKKYFLNRKYVVKCIFLFVSFFFQTKAINFCVWIKARLLMFLILKEKSYIVIPFLWSFDLRYSEVILVCWKYSSFMIF